MRHLVSRTLRFTCFLLWGDFISRRLYKGGFSGHSFTKRSSMAVHSATEGFNCAGEAFYNLRSRRSKLGVGASDVFRIGGGLCRAWS